MLAINDDKQKKFRFFFQFIRIEFFFSREIRRFSHKPLRQQFTKKKEVLQREKKCEKQYSHPTKTHNEIQHSHTRILSRHQIKNALKLIDLFPNLPYSLDQSWTFV